MKVLILLALLGLSSAYPNGAPIEVCTSMFPNHNASAQTSSPADHFTIELSGSPTTYNHSEPQSITVTIKSIGADNFFEGFFVQARRADCTGNRNDAPLGTFTAGSSNYTTRSCAGIPNSAITHLKKYHYPSVSFDWMTPSTDEGPLYLRATVVKHEDEFWMDVNTDILKSTADPSVVGKVCNPQLVDPNLPGSAGLLASSVALICLSVLFAL